MKRLLLPVLVLMLIGTLAFAEGAPKGGDFGIQGSASLPFTSSYVGSPMGSLGVKYFFTDNVAIRAAVGLDNVSVGGGSTTDYMLAAGFEYHFGGKGGVSPYLGAQVSYSGFSLSGGGATSSDFGLRAVFGGEYFFSSNFSWSGELGLGFDSAYAPGPPAATTTRIGTAAFTTAVTWYIN